DVRFAADGRLVSCSEDGTARVWDLKDYEDQLGPNSPPGSRGPQVIRTAAAAAPSDTDARYDAARAQVLHGHDAGLLGATAAPDGRLVTVGQDRMLRAWDLQSPDTHPIALRVLERGPGPRRASAAEDGPERSPVRHATLRGRGASL